MSNVSTKQEKTTTRTTALGEFAMHFVRVNFYIFKGYFVLIVRERKENNNSVGVSLNDYSSSYMLHVYSYLLSTKQDEATTTTTTAAALWEFAVHLVETLTILHVEVALLRSNTTVLVYHH